MKYEKMVKKVGFCLRDDFTYKEGYPWIDWSNDYDDAMVRLLLMFKKKLKKRDREIAKLQHELAKTKVRE